LGVAGVRRIVAVVRGSGLADSSGHVDTCFDAAAYWPALEDGMLAQITLSNFLSFGPGAHTLTLRPLNVLIGPNGSGKSNVVEAFAVLRAVPRDLPLPIRQGGGVEEWLWRIGPGRRAQSAALDVLFTRGLIAKAHPVRYRVEFGSEFFMARCATHEG
jgi:predicted ATPase